ncbi:MAG: Rne/Rng family ribonuclease [Bdellovibrionota bacterium]
MERYMLINAVHPEECRIAIIEGNKPIELEIESNAGKKLKGNIYKAKIARVEPSLQAAFVDIGAERNGFLQINDIHPSYFKKGYTKKKSVSQIKIQDVVETGQEVIVQVVKEERDLKGATLTTYLSLPGRYIVLMLGNDKGGVSRKGSANERSRLKKLTQELKLPDGMGIIIRTAGLDRSHSELSRDLSIQLDLWNKIQNRAKESSTPTILYTDGDFATRVIRDYFTPAVREIVIDNPSTYELVKEFVQEVMPRYRSRVKLYNHPEPIFTHYNIEDSVIETFEREVKLPSGGAIVIEPVEALVAIDVNSGKGTDGEGIEDTAFRTNMEAAEVIASQLRLRDLGGLIVIDFIDMLDKKHRIELEKKMLEVIKEDKARIEIGTLSRFGLLEMSRQRIRASLASQSHITCQSCKGLGKIRNPELIALEVLKKIQAAVILGKVSLVQARLSTAPTVFLLNNKKRELTRLEAEYEVRILIVPDARLRVDEYELVLKAHEDDDNGKKHLIDSNKAKELTTKSKSTFKNKRKTLTKKRRFPTKKAEK